MKKYSALEVLRKRALHLLTYLLTYLLIYSLHKFICFDLYALAYLSAADRGCRCSLK